MSYPQRQEMWPPAPRDKRDCKPRLQLCWGCLPLSLDEEPVPLIPGRGPLLPVQRLGERGPGRNQHTRAMARGDMGRGGHQGRGGRSVHRGRSGVRDTGARQGNKQALQPKVPAIGSNEQGIEPRRGHPQRRTGSLLSRKISSMIAGSVQRLSRGLRRPRGDMPTDPVQLKGSPKLGASLTQGPHDLPQVSSSNMGRDSPDLPEGPPSADRGLGVRMDSEDHPG